MRLGEHEVLSVVYNPGVIVMEYAIAHFSTPQVKVEHWDKLASVFKDVPTEAICYKNTDFALECEIYAFQEIPPLGYEIFRYMLDNGDGYKKSQVSSFGFDGLFDENGVSEPIP